MFFSAGEGDEGAEKMREFFSPSQSRRSFYSRSGRRRPSVYLIARRGIARRRLVFAAMLALVALGVAVQRTVSPGPPGAAQCRKDRRINNCRAYWGLAT